MAGALVAVTAVWMVGLCYFDFRYRRLPNWLTLPGAVAVLATGFATRGLAVLAGAGALFLIYLVVHLLAPRAMGAGDVKLALGTGGLAGGFGLDVWCLAAIGAPAATGLVGLILLVAGRRNSSVPHGPAMCVATIAAIAVSGCG